MHYGIALGSNLGDRLLTILAATDRLAELGRVVAAAPIYRTTPVGCTDGDPFFLNTVLEIETELPPLRLLSETQRIEADLGRAPERKPNAPRVIDIDLLYARRGIGTVSHHSDELELPHPRLHTRRFVLEPLVYIRPALVIGARSVHDHLAGLVSAEPPLTLVTQVSNPEKLELLAGAKAAGQQIVAITAYDYPVARLLDEAGVDLILVGDSLGMVVLGHEDTTGVTLDMMLHHTRACRRGIQRAVLLADLPIGTYDTPNQALASARQLTAAGADAVKLEGGTGQLEKVRAIRAAGIKVIGHIGMLPQRVLEEGGYKKKGKTEAGLQSIVDDARGLEEAGVEAIIIESTVAAAAHRAAGAVQIPIIGIGAGKDCDGQIRVVHDVLGSYPWFVPRFAKTHANLAAETTRAARSYIEAVRARRDA